MLLAKNRGALHRLLAPLPLDIAGRIAASGRGPEQDFGLLSRLLNSQRSEPRHGHEPPRRRATAAVRGIANDEGLGAALFDPQPEACEIQVPQVIPGVAAFRPSCRLTWSGGRSMIDPREAAGTDQAFDRAILYGTLLELPVGAPTGAVALELPPSWCL